MGKSTHYTIFLYYATLYNVHKVSSKLGGRYELSTCNFLEIFANYREIINLGLNKYGKTTILIEILQGNLEII